MLSLIYVDFGNIMLSLNSVHLTFQTSWDGGTKDWGSCEMLKKQTPVLIIPWEQVIHKRPRCSLANAMKVYWI